MDPVGLLAAFVAGALSISSPCVLPLVPLYVAHLAGVGPDGAPPRRRIVILHALAFVSGFGLLFVLLGVSLGALGGLFQLYRPWLIQAGGVFMVLMGLQLIGILRLSFLGREHRLAPAGSDTRRKRPMSSFLVGVSFAAGWTPCVGPVLGAVLTRAVGAADPLRSGMLLGAYAAGLAVPFLAVGLAIGGLQVPLRRVGVWLTPVSGAVLMAVGMLMLSGIYQRVFAHIVGVAPWTPWEPGL